jgi:hypothetical protein
MGRRQQYFIAPGDEDQDLPIASSPWHIGRYVHIPAEHWEILTDFIEIHLPEYKHIFKEASYLDGDFLNWSMEKEAQFRRGLLQLKSLLNKSEDLVYELTDEVREDYPNSEYIRMIDAIIAVVDESIKFSVSFDSYVN